MSKNTTEKKPKKAATKKKVSVEEKSTVAATIRAKSAPRYASAKSGNEAASSKTTRMPSHEEVSSLARIAFRATWEAAWLSRAGLVPG